MYDYNRDLIYFIKRDGTTENPYKTISENVYVLYEKVFLEEVPVQSFKVVVKVGETNLIEVGRWEDIKSSNQYFVNYKQGIVYFHSSQNNIQVTLNYRGQGVLLYPASRIYVDSEVGARDVVKTLRDLITEGVKALDAVAIVNEIVARADEALTDIETAVINSQNAIKTIENKISELNIAEADRLAKENERIANENARILSEQERVQAENQRKLNSEAYNVAESERANKEAERLTKENERISNENARIESETARSQAEANRIIAESERIARDASSASAEEARNVAEVQRELNEDGRISAEIERVNAENQRKLNSENYETNELARISKENERISAENQRAINEDSRIESESLRSTAEVERVNAESERVNSYLLITEAENVRIASENERKTNEQTRISNEEARVAKYNEVNAKEELRISAEIERATAELLRVENENSRQSTFNTSIVELGKLKTDVQKATSDALTVTNSANEITISLQELIENTRYQEVFNIDKTYYKNNIVMYNGSSYIAKSETTGNIPTNEIYWGLLAQRGVDGKGSIVTVNGMSPDLNGNVVISPDIIGAESTSKKGVANGYAGLDGNGKIPLHLVPDTLKQQTYVVADENERNQLINLMSGDKAYERLTGDSYIFDGEQWLVLADADWENVSLDWTNISNKPNSSIEDIDSAVLKSHTHSNKDILDGFALVGGRLQHNNNNIGNVDSVNGKTGAVTINANDVGAYSKSEVDSIISNYSPIEVLDSTPTTMDKTGLLYIKKSVINAEAP